MCMKFFTVLISKIPILKTQNTNNHTLLLNDIFEKLKCLKTQTGPLVLKNALSQRFGLFDEMDFFEKRLLKNPNGPLNGLKVHSVHKIKYRQPPRWLDWYPNFFELNL